MGEPHDFLAEDLGTGDVTTKALIGDQLVKAVIFAKEPCVVAGLRVAASIFGEERLQVNILIPDGSGVEPGDVVMEIEGYARALLATERLALNFIQRLSGVATITRELVDICRPINPEIRIAATRKTTPGIRRFEKDAVEIGGGYRHREGLYDQILIKDNHLKIVGSISEAVRRARDSGLSKVVEVEVVDLAGAEEAARAGADIIMLDNMSPDDARASADAVRTLHPGAIVEVSGGITPSNITEYAEFADVISLGWLTHSVKAMDFSLEIVEIRKG